MVSYFPYKSRTAEFPCLVDVEQKSEILTREINSIYFSINNNQVSVLGPISVKEQLISLEKARFWLFPARIAREWVNARNGPGYFLNSLFPVFQWSLWCFSLPLTGSQYWQWCSPLDSYSYFLDTLLDKGYLNAPLVILQTYQTS